MHNQRNRRAAKANVVVKAKPAGNSGQPHRVAPPALFVVPAQPKAIKPTRRKTAKRKATKRKAANKAAITLPQIAEPLVSTGQALAPYRPGGLIGQLNRWLSGRVTQVWQQLGKLGQNAPKPRRPAAQLRQLRAENAKLKAQLEAVLALQQSNPTGAREGTLLPHR